MLKKLTGLISVLFSSKKKKLEPTSTQDDVQIRVLKINKRRFVVGLKWQTIRYQVNIMKAIKAIGRKKNLDVVAVRKSDSYQAGFAPKTKQKLRGGYSLVVALADLLKGCSIAIIKIGVNGDGVTEYTMAGRNAAGGIHPMSDEIILEDALYQKMVDMKAQLRGNNEDLQVPIYGDMDEFDWVTEQLNLEEILSPANLSKDFKLKPLTLGMTDQRIISIISLAVVCCVAAYFLNQYKEEQEQKENQRKLQLAIAQNEINKKARYKTALDNLRHPWITQPSVMNFISTCKSGLRRLSPSIEGWTPVQFSCLKDGMYASYVRPKNSVATTARFIDAVKGRFDSPVNFNYTQTSLTDFSFQHEYQSEGDDPVNEMSIQLVKMISLFQSLNIAASFSPVDIKDKIKNDLDEELPLQDWQEYVFSVTTDVPPQLIFKTDDFKGIRIQSIKYKSGQNEAINYEISGSIYGKRPKETYPVH